NNDTSVAKDSITGIVKWVVKANGSALAVGADDSLIVLINAQ
ncbi:MAG: hypothetical protein ACD_78C00070G0007, partial [uncultured bacterium (gcode 4)]